MTCIEEVVGSIDDFDESLKMTLYLHDKLEVKLDEFCAL